MADFRVITSPGSIWDAISNAGSISVTTESPNEAYQFAQYLESNGYKKLYYTSSTNTFTYSNVVDGAADMSGVQEYGLSAVNTETYIDPQTTKKMFRIGGLAADVGLNIVDGGVTAAVSTAQLGAAVSLGAGIGLKSAEAYPAFWNALALYYRSDAEIMFGNLPDRINELADYIRESADMNYTVNSRNDYVNSRTGSWEEDIAYLKSFLEKRLAWYSSQFN